jgi:deoxyribodipyrimidine photo-lyase
MTTAIVWFRRDLRLQDNPALAAALREHDRVACVYVHAPDDEAPWAPGAASRWWLRHSLSALAADLKKRGANLHIFSGDANKVLASVVRKTNADAVYWNRLYEPAIIKRDQTIEKTLRNAGVDVRTFNANLLFEPWEIETGAGGPYKVFTPFWRNARARLIATPPLAAPRKIQSVSLRGATTLKKLDLLPKIKWDAEFYDHWEPGEHGAHRLLRRFKNDTVKNYRKGRDRPDFDDTSRLSPHLHFGEIGPRQIFWSFHNSAKGHSITGDADFYIRELGWREFSHHLMFHFPKTPNRNLNPQFDRFPWVRRNASALAKWQRGKTGIPIVDAGMRQLWKTGWMHNRVRMLVASFLTKNLRVHWLEGARWFWDTLVDADLANNTQGWQWTAGSGADAAPYFRIFNPVTQGERFDPQGVYVRRWVRELANVPAPLIHQPSKDAAILKKTGYPKPMVDLKTSREQALDAYARMRSGK